jgi:tape measure domain-containing protein
MKELKEMQTKGELSMEELRKALTELAKAQTRGELSMEELRKAEERSERRIEELAKAQERTEKSIEELRKSFNELAKAQVRTEKALALLVEEHKKTRLQLVGLSKTLGFGLEDKDVKIFVKNTNTIIKAQKKDYVRFLFGYVLYPPAMQEAEKENIIMIASYGKP